MTFDTTGQTSSINYFDDRIKPNFIHSSDIPKKLANLVYSIAKSKYKNSNINSNKCQTSINLNLKLNSLIQKGSNNLKICLNKKMISIAQSSNLNQNLLASNLIVRQSFKNSNFLNDIITEKNKLNKQIYPHALTTNDIFIIKFKLIIREINENEIDFEDDEQYQILKSFESNNNILQNLKKYTLHYYNSSTENSTKEQYLENNLLDVSDSTLDNDEINYSDDYDNYKIETLISNETLIDEFKRRFSEVSTEEKSINSNKSFIKNISNLRHNDDDDEDEDLEIEELHLEDKFKDHAGLSKQSSRQSPITPSSDHHIHLDDLVEVSFEENDDYYNELSPEKFISSSPIKNNNNNKQHFNLENTQESSNKFKLSNQPSFTSPTKERKSISRMSSTHSVSMINTDEKYGLEYAYNSDSSTIPTYIKQNKKFKFIKVGKVQKFVDLFEEGGVDKKK
ncbi:CTA9 [Candida pseudojiufengensis]|uniref:CTA9 n=1 Tax=Candida pseudojiufengensis TaxID=497109 RepID=UPI0022250B43|nr:CTA9 [Candida pseudojiufengensis]KAI5966143.1 CTA9 [Candida pseudojiufengensis]